MMMYEASNPGSKEMFCIRKVEEGCPLLVHELENVYYRVAALDGGIQRVCKSPTFVFTPASASPTPAQVLAPS